MTKMNPKNERLKLDYEDCLKNDEGLAESTITQKLDAIYRYEMATDFEDFKTFDRKKAIAFIGTITGTTLANATRLSIVNHVKAFFKSLAMDGVINGKKSRRTIAALRLSRKDTRAGQGQKPKAFATVAKFKRIVENMPSDTAIQLRNRALIAIAPLSGTGWGNHFLSPKARGFGAAGSETIPGRGRHKGEQINCNMVLSG
jgi:site-specific recombinase XerD